VGVERIASIIGDREFIGEKWMSRLQELGIPFCLRFPKNLKTPKGETKTASEPLQKKKMVALRNGELNDRRVNVFLKRLSGGEYLLLMGSFQPENLEKVYKKR
jgi:hypothetical protein